MTCDIAAGPMGAAMQNYPDTIYRCGYCGYPTDSTGEPLELCNDFAQLYIKLNEDKPEVLTHGTCCTAEEVGWHG